MKFHRYEVIASEDNSTFFVFDDDEGRVIHQTTEEAVAKSVCFNLNNIRDYDFFRVPDVSIQS